MKKLLALVLVTMLAVSVCSFAVAESKYPTQRTLYFGEAHNPDTVGELYSGGNKDPRLEEDWDGDEFGVIRFENMTAVENDYNVKVYGRVQTDLTDFFTNTTKEFDLVHTNGQNLIQWAKDGFLVDLKTIAPADHDVFTTMEAGQTIDVGLDGVYFLRPYGMDNTNLLAVNMDLLEDAGLEDPRELWERGEWTWEKFLEYCEALAQDLDGDGINDQYGFGGWPQETFDGFLMSTGAAIIDGPVAKFDSTEVGEVLELIEDMYVNRDVCAPFSWSHYPDMVFQYTQGNVGMSPMAVWMLSNNGCYLADGTGSADWTTIFCPYPVGPSGDAETNRMVQVGGDNYVYAIPAQAEDPERIFNAWYDIQNWFGGDLSLRDDPRLTGWWAYSTDRDPVNQDANLAWQVEALSRPQVEMHRAAGVDEYGWISNLMMGYETPAQIQESYKQLYQAYADSIFGAKAE